MSSVSTNLVELFERACEARDRVNCDPHRVAADLNREVAKKKLAGRLVVLEIPDYKIADAYKGRQHSHLYPSGRLGGFAVDAYSNESDPELFAVIHDIRGPGGTKLYTTLDGDETPYDVAEQQMDSGLFADVKKLLLSPDFSFPELARMCEKVGNQNLDMSLFATSLNGFRLPHAIASKVFTLPVGVSYLRNGKDIAPPSLELTGYDVGISDMFALLARRSIDRPSLHITDMIPDSPLSDFRNILIDHDVLGYDRAP